MARIFWTIKRKMKLSQLSKDMSIDELAVRFKKPREEVQKVLTALHPARGMVEDVKIIDGIRYTFYRAAWAEGAYQQHCGQQHIFY